MSFSRSPRTLFTSRFVQFCSLILTLGVAAACGASGSAAVDPKANAAFSIEVTKASLTVVNQTGGTITDGLLNVFPVGLPLPYVVNLSRMSNSEKRTFPLETLRMLDGTKFRLNVTKISRMKVTAKDVVGKPIEYELSVR
jgi:hypothetical protein